MQPKVILLFAVWLPLLQITGAINSGTGSITLSPQCSNGLCWPLYYILGAPKAGSSSLWELFHEQDRRKGHPARRQLVDREAKHDRTAAIVAKSKISSRTSQSKATDPDATPMHKKGPKMADGGPAAVGAQKKMIAGGGRRPRNPENVKARGLGPRPAVGVGNNFSVTAAPLSRRHDAGQYHICTSRKEVRFWANSKAFSGTDINTMRDIEGYLRNFRSNAASCPHGRYVEATPTYLGDEFAAARVQKYYPESLKDKLRFMASLRHPASRDLSWFNVLYSEAQKKLGSMPAEQERHGSRGPGAKKLTPIPNNAGIMTIPVTQLCWVRDGAVEPPPVVGEMYAPSRCYDMYVKSSADMYQTCASNHPIDPETKLFEKYVDDVKVIVLRAMNQMGSNIEAVEVSQFQVFINELAALSLTYESCSSSSILRTGLYAPQILNWLRHWDANQLLLLSYSDLFESNATDSNIGNTSAPNNLVPGLIRKMFAHFLSSDVALNASIEDKLQFLQTREGVEMSSVLPHSNPTRGSFKLRVNDVSCAALCELDHFFLKPSRLAATLIRLVYGPEHKFDALFKSMGSSCQCNQGQQAAVDFSKQYTNNVTVAVESADRFRNHLNMETTTPVRNSTVNPDEVVVEGKKIKAHSPWFFVVVFVICVAVVSMCGMSDPTARNI